LRVSSAPANSMLDRIGMILSFGCAIHCALMPLLIAWLTFNGFGWIGEESTEWTIIIASLAIASLRLTWSYLKEHRHPVPLMLFAAGTLSILLARSVFMEVPEMAETVGMVLGGCLIGGAHLVNQRQCNCCRTAS
jgi:hypothetical protein